MKDVFYFTFFTVVALVAGMIGSILRERFDGWFIPKQMTDVQAGEYEDKTGMPVLVSPINVQPDILINQPTISDVPAVLVKQVAKPNEDAVNLASGYQFSNLEYQMQDFMQAAEQATPVMPTLSDEKVQKLRVDLIAEELDELREAYAAGSLVDVADAVTDLAYVVIGTAVAHGLNLNALWLAVHENNMQKMLNGYRAENGKWIKPEGHLPPDLESILVAQWRAMPFRADAEAVTCDCGKTNRQHPVEEIKPSFFSSDTYELTVLCNGIRVKL